MNKIYKTTITPELTTYIQRLFYDVEMRKNIIKDLIRDEGESIKDNDNYKFYSEELATINFEYQEANAQLERAILPEDFIGQHVYEWSLNFSTNVVTLTVKDPDGIKKLEDAGYVLE